MSNPHATAARLVKAIKLADVLETYSLTVCDARVMLDEHWRNVAHVAGVNPPSAETIALVIERLRYREVL